MAFEFGQVTMFNDPVSMGKPIIQALAKAIELPSFTGVVYQMAGAPSTAITQKTFELYNRTKSVRESVVGTTAWAATGTTGLSLGDGILGLTVGHVLQIKNEIVVVKSVNRTARTIDVQARGMAGTTSATHAIGTPVAVIGHAGRDYDLKNMEGVSESTQLRQNYVQSVFEKFSWLKEAELARHGLERERWIAQVV